MSIYILDFKQATFTSEADILFVENISNLDFKIGCILISKGFSFLDSILYDDNFVLSPGT